MAASVIGRDHKSISMPPSDNDQLHISPLHARTSTEMYAHALASAPSSPSPSPSLTSKVAPTPSILARQDSIISTAASAAGIVCCCSICQDAVGNYNNETTCDTAARMIRIMNRSFVGEAIKFITTVALAFLIGYYALKSQMTELKNQVSDLRTQVDAANIQLTQQVSQARIDIQAQVVTATSGLDSRLSSTSIAIDSLTTVLRTFPDAVTINATVNTVNNLDIKQLSQQVIVIRQHVNNLTHDTEILQENITITSQHLDNITSQYVDVSQQLHNVTSQYRDVSQQLQQALVNTSQQYDHNMMLMNTTASAHLMSLRYLGDNVAFLIRDDIQRMSQLHTNLFSQLQQLNRTIINDVINQYGMGIQMINASINTATSLIYDTWSRINRTTSISQSQLQQTISALAYDLARFNNTFDLLARFNNTLDTRLIQHSIVAQHYGVAAACSSLLPAMNTSGSSIFTIPVDTTFMTRTCADYCGSKSCVGAVAQTTDPSASAVISPPLYMNPNSTDPSRSLSRASTWSSIAPSSFCSTPIMSLWNGQSRSLTGLFHVERQCDSTNRTLLFTIPNDFQQDTMNGTIEIQYNFTTFCRCQTENVCSSPEVVCLSNFQRSQLVLLGIGSGETRTLAEWRPPRSLTTNSTFSSIVWRSNTDILFHAGQLVMLDIKTDLNTNKTDLNPRSACFGNIQAIIIFRYQDKEPTPPQHQRYCCCTTTVT